MNPVRCRMRSEFPLLCWLAALLAAATLDRTDLDQNIAVWAALIWLAAETGADFRALSAAEAAE
ncbi:hypothetical protein [Luteimonas suaedae]|uniref:hypothetical protein n=1 Tax=Luteimonas suaedae TaxID=2605430 RepID=UPI0011EC76B3|nr:hypothetical protein [Luteimonas suaedae]